jgi:hypothetical protein
LSANCRQQLRCGRRPLVDRPSQETSVCVERPGQGSSNLDAVLTGLQGRAATFAPGTLAGAGVYLQTGRIWQALLLACLVGPPTSAAGTVLAEWVRLLEPPRRWHRPRVGHA